MSNKQSVGDTAGFFEDIESAKAYAHGQGAHTPRDYHEDRMRALHILLDQMNLPETFSVLDFGCGEGMYFREFFAGKTDQVSRIVGVDISSPMIDLARETLGSFPFEGIAGDARALSDIQGSFDVGLAIDVLGYLDETELALYYTEMSRLIRPGGYLIVMYGNELFDLYALNGGTAAFFQKHFSVDVGDLLTESGAAQYTPVERRNPLSFAAEISDFGFEEISQSFSQWHTVPPAIGNRGGDVAAARLEMRDHAFDPNALPPRERWKAAFRSSIFASLSRRR